MKPIIFFCSCILFSYSSIAQNVGIGTSLPVHKLHVITSAASINAIYGINNGSSDGTDWNPANNFAGVHGEGASGTTQYQAGVYGYQMGAGNNSGGVVGAYNSSIWGGLGYTDGSGFRWGVYTPSGLYAGGNVGIGTSTPGFLLDVAGRMRVRYGGGNTAGIWFRNSTNSADPGFVGLLDDSHLGLYGSGSSWNLVMNTTNGNVGIGTTAPDRTLKVISSTTVAGKAVIHGEFTGVGNIMAFGVYGRSVPANNYGIGGLFEGGNTGVLARVTSSDGLGIYYGVFGSCTGSFGTNYGVYAEANGGNGSINYAGYFAGDVYTTGFYLPSDRKLKKNIKPLNEALTLVNRLNPSVYTYRTEAYKQMNLPEGLQYGLIADEVQQVLPGIVTKAVQPAEYENQDEQKGKKLSDKVEFNAINYTEMIPILIAAVKEQQAMITDQQKQIETLKTEMEKMKAIQKL